MKKVLLTIFATVGFIMLVPATSFAKASTTDISGVITNAGHTVNGAHVTVVCDGHSKKAGTNKKGAYLVQFKAKQCPNGSKVTIVATKNGKGGTNSGTVTSDTAKLNVAIINASLPEMGVATGTLAAVSGATGLFVIRRRQVGKS